MDDRSTESWHSLYPVLQKLMALDWGAFREALCDSLAYPRQLSWQLGDDRLLFDTAHAAASHGNITAQWPAALPAEARLVAQMLPVPDFAAAHVLRRAVRKLNTYISPPLYVLDRCGPLRSKRLPFCDSADVDRLAAVLGGSLRNARVLLQYVRTLAVGHAGESGSAKLRLVLQQDVVVAPLQQHVAHISHNLVALTEANVRHEPTIFEDCVTLTCTLQSCRHNVRIAPW